MSKENIQSTQSTPEEAILNLLEVEDEENTDTNTEEEKEVEKEEEEEKEEENTEEQPKYRVKIDGEEQEVPLEELLKGYQRQADYTRKTQKIAEERRKLQEAFSEVSSEREAYKKTLSALESQLGGQEPNWEELQARLSPQELAHEMATFQRRQKALQALKLEQQRIAQIEQLRTQEMLSRQLEMEKELLTSAIPEWVDAEVAQKERKAIVEYAKKNGFTAEELENVYDHRAVVLLRKAWLYDQGKAKVQHLQRENKQTPSPGKSGRIDAGKFKKAQQRLKESGRIEDAAAVFESLL